MNLAVLLWQDAQSNPQSIPGVWPAQVVELGSSTMLPNDGQNWQLMTDAQYAAYKAANQSAYDAWYAPIVAAQQAAAQATEQTSLSSQYGMCVIAQFRAYISQLSVTQVLAIMQSIIANGGAVLQLLQLGLLAEANTALLAINNMPFLLQPYNPANPTGPTVQQYFSSLILAGVPS